MYRKIFTAQTDKDLLVELPKEYLNKEIEVIAFQVNEDDKALEDNFDFNEAVKFFDSMQTDMSNFKFNRDEANER